MIRIDINCDLGEGTGNDALLMPHISSCNVACGGHFGDAQSIKNCLKLAKKHQVKVGAHPSFEDKENFGRVRLDWGRSRFRESVTKQLQNFTSVATELGMELHHIKMHGALYHATANEPDFAEWCVELLREFYPNKPIYSLPDSLLHQLCKKYNQPFIAEAFADRAYQANGQLVARSEIGSVLHNVQEVCNQIESIAKFHQVKSIQGEIIQLQAETLCIHGDNLKLVRDFPKLIENLFQKEIEVA